METDRETEVRETKDKESSEQNRTEGRENSIWREYGFASDVKLKECRYCRVMIPKKAKVCPNCRMSLKRHWFRNLAAAVFAVAVIGVGGYFLSEHWGIMQDAVMSVWMAQDGAAVPAVSVTTVGTVEMAAGAATAETSEVTVSKEAEIDSSSETAKEEAVTEAEESVDSGETSSEEEKEAQTGGESEAKGESGSDKEVHSEEAPERNHRDAETQADTDQEESDRDAASRNDKEQNLSEEKIGNSDIAKQADDDLLKDQETEDTPNTVAAKETDREEKRFRDDCVEAGYKSLLRDKDAYLETALKLDVQVICQVNGGLFDESIYYFCKTEDTDGIERCYIIRDDRATDDTLILEGDILTVYGRLFGSCRLPFSLMETRPTVPAVSMLYFDLVEE